MVSKHNYWFMLAFERRNAKLKDPCMFCYSLAIEVLRILLVKQVIVADGSGVRRPCFASRRNREKYILPYRMSEMNVLM